MKNKNWSLRYTLINVFYFVAFATVHGFATIFLLSRGFSNTEVGIALAVSNILSVIGQPFFAGIVDKSENITNRRVLMASAAIMLIGAFALSFLQGPKALIFALYVLIYTAIITSVWQGASVPQVLRSRQQLWVPLSRRTVPWWICT